jgi:hypothetical protein
MKHIKKFNENIGSDNTDKNDIIRMIKNEDDLYEGDLKAYFNLIMKSPNAYAPYHNVRHMLHVFWESYDGAIYMKLNKREMRNLLISALFHDYNHMGVKGDDSINIERAFEALDQHLLEEDRPYIDIIKKTISSTKYPYNPNEKFTENELILRDADQSQTFSSVWIQSVLYGLGKELEMTYEQMLRLQIPFLENMKFYTKWGLSRFQPLINPRIRMVKNMISLIED